MKPVTKMQDVTLPSAIVAEAREMLELWPSENKQFCAIGKNYHGSGRNGKPSLSDSMESFMNEVLKERGVTRRVMHPALLLFKDVHAHTDDCTYIKDDVCGIMHVIVEGTGTLRMPDTNSEFQTLELKPGVMFCLDVRWLHAVENASPGGIASISIDAILPGEPVGAA